METTTQTVVSGTAYDVDAIRSAFPVLSRTVHDGVPLSYLDNAATTQKPLAVLDAVQDYYRRSNSNVHRALHVLGEEATAAYEGARKSVADFVHAPSERGVVFTRGTTEAINLVAQAWGRQSLKPGDRILTTQMEHHSNLVPWQLLARATGAELDYVPVLEDGHLDLEAFHRALSPRVKLVAATHMSNILGTVNPIPKMARAAHDVGALMLVDGAQSVPHFPVDVQALDCDFLAFSGHKMYGPTGIGVLVAREDLLEEMSPYQSGGEMILKVTMDTATWADIPHKFEAGTPNIAGAVGLHASIRYLEGIGLKAIQAHEDRITRYALERLGSISGLRILGRASPRGGVVSFLLDGVHPHDVAQFVDRSGVAVRAGHGCAQPLLRAFGAHAVTRASFSLYTVEAEIDRLVDALVSAREFFSHGI